MKNIRFLCSLFLILCLNNLVAANLPESLKEIQKKALELVKEDYISAKLTAVADTEYLADFTDHTTEHILMVADKSLEIIEVFEQAIEQNILQKKESIERNKSDGNKINFGGGINRTNILLAALFHDSGMKKGGFVLNKDGYVTFDENSKSKMAISGYDIRKNHALNSAINVLLKRRELEKLGGDVDEIALLAFSHSKSTSGIRNLNNKNDWISAFRRFEKIIEVFNKENENKIYFNGKGYESDEEKFSRLVTSALAIRLGDVSRDSGRHAKAQNGGDIVVYTSTVNSLGGSAQEEVKNALVYNYALGPVKSLFSKQVHVGEQNNIFNRTFIEASGQLFHEMTMKSGNYAPYSTFQNVIEHCGELESAPDADIKVAILFSDSVDKNFKLVYNKMRQDYYDKKGGKAIPIIYPWDCLVTNTSTTGDALILY